MKEGRGTGVCRMRRGFASAWAVRGWTITRLATWLRSSKLSKLRRRAAFGKHPGDGALRG